MLPHINTSANARFPIVVTFLQKRGGTIRHDAVAWGFARAADQRGVDIIQNCEVLGFERRGSRILAVVTSKGRVECDRVGFAVAGHSSVVAEMAGFRLPLTSHALQAMVSEPVKPILDHVVISPATGVYVNQTQRGELVMGGNRPLPVVCPARQFSYDRESSHGSGGDVPSLRPVTADASLGWHRGYSSGQLTYHRSNTCRQSLHQLWMGHRGIQSHSSGRSDVSAFSRNR